MKLGVSAIHIPAPWDRPEKEGPGRREGRKKKGGRGIPISSGPTHLFLTACQWSDRKEERREEGKKRKREKRKEGRFRPAGVPDQVLSPLLPGGPGHHDHQGRRDRRRRRGKREKKREKRKKEPVSASWLLTSFTFFKCQQTEREKPKAVYKGEKSKMSRAA